VPVSIDTNIDAKQTFLDIEIGTTTSSLIVVLVAFRKKDADDAKYSNDWYKVRVPIW